MADKVAEKTKTKKGAKAAPQSSGQPAEKLRMLRPEELQLKEKEMRDQLFRLKFQRSLGQTESLTKMRGLRKDIARTKTIVRERELAAVKAETK